MSYDTLYIAELAQSLRSCRLEAVLDCNWYSRCPMESTRWYNCIRLLIEHFWGVSSHNIMNHQTTSASLRVPFARPIILSPGLLIASPNLTVSAISGIRGCHKALLGPLMFFKP